MKTAIQQLIEEMNEMQYQGQMFWIKQPNEFFEKYIKKEKDQTNKAYYQAIYDKNQGQIKDEYYNQTYNQNK